MHAGVCLSALLPTTLWEQVAVPQLVQWTGIPLSSFPLAQIPDQATWLLIAAAAAPIAAVVFNEGGFDAWQAVQRPLLARMVAATAAGVRWPRVWLRRCKEAPTALVP